jgi:hypothetical protein
MNVGGDLRSTGDAPKHVSFSIFLITFCNLRVSFSTLSPSCLIMSFKNSYANWAFFEVTSHRPGWHGPCPFNFIERRRRQWETKY